MPQPRHPIFDHPVANRLRSLLQGLRPSEHTAVMGMAMVVGLLGGFGNILYRRMIELVHRVVFEGGGELLNLERGWPWLLLLPLLPMVGAVLLIPLAALFPGEVRGYGLPKFLEAVNLKGAVFRARTVVVKSVASAITIGSGGSAGTEGPIAQIGGAIGSLVGQALNVGQDRLRTLVACGVAAGIGGTFNAPIAGVFFAHELVLCRSFVTSSFVPVVISSGLGAMVTRAVEGNRPAFQVPHYLLRTPWEALLYVPLGILVGLAAVHFIRSFYSLTDRFQAWGAPGWFKPVVGAALAGTLGIAFPQVMGDGYHHVELALAGQLTGWALVLVALAKMYATGFTLGSGNAGGVFAPSLVIGAMLGGAYGWAMDLLFPGFAAGPGSYALVGMGGFLAAATHAPMTAIFLIFEMTGEYTVIVPIMFACVIGYSVSRWLQPDSIDHLELTRRGIHLEEGRETNVLKSIQVGTLMTRQVESFPESTPLGVMLRAIPSSRHVTFPLVDEAGKLSGIISLQDFREVAYEEGLADLVVAGELGTREVITVFPDDSVHDALARIGYRNIEHLPVVSRADPREILGMLSRQDILSAYNKALIDRSLRAPEG